MANGFTIANQRKREGERGLQMLRDAEKQRAVAKCGLATGHQRELNPEWTPRKKKIRKYRCVLCGHESNWDGKEE